MNSRTAKALRRQITHANVKLTPGAWRVVKCAWESGSRTNAQLMRGVRLVRNADGLHGLTPKEEHLLRAYAATHGQLESDARVCDAAAAILCTVVGTVVVGAVALALAVAVALMLPV